MIAEMHRTLTNEITRKIITLPTPTGIEKLYDGKRMISETDINGIITYVSRHFCEVTGYDRETLIGIPHRIMRHPDMPVGLFRGMWNTILRKRVWGGYIKSLCKDGSHFWAFVYIQPKVNDKGNITGFVAIRKKAEKKDLLEVEEMYTALQGSEHMDHPYFRSFELFFDENVADFSQRA